MKTNKTRTLVECSLMVAMATILSYIPIFEMPMGGSITLCSMMPLIVISFRHGAKWGVGVAAVYGIFQMMLGFKNVLYCTTILAMFGCIMLDYIIAYSVIGLACVFGRCVSGTYQRVIVGTLIAGILRLFCSFLSGILIWGGYAPEGTAVWIYSLIYNSSFMIPELIITIVAVVPVLKLLNKRAVTQN